MDEEIEISLKLSRQQREKADQRRNRFRRCQRQEDEFLLCKYRSLPLRDSNHISFEASENGNMLTYADDQRTIGESANEMDRARLLERQDDDRNAIAIDDELGAVRQFAADFLIAQMIEAINARRFARRQ